MSVWYRKISDNLSNIPDCISHYEKECSAAKKELSSRDNKTIEKHCAELPGILEHRYSQLQEIEGILEYLNILLTKLKSKKFKKYYEHYNRALTSQDCKKYVDGDEEVVNMSILVNEFALVRNSYLSLMKGLDAKHWMLSNITKLRVAGVEDAAM